MEEEFDAIKEARKWRWYKFWFNWYTFKLKIAEFLYKMADKISGNV